ncbi:MAG TPA: LAGLIDADG family homing endonuclease [Gammaproteobacteria bacterium]|nr:LAGLIDADG family homing endonuclease [Gammaproteobacteria bacterium]
MLAHNTPRILHTQDEGIVQPVSKETDQAVPPPPPTKAAGPKPAALLTKQRKAGGLRVASETVNALTPESAAYIAGLIDGEGTITLTREHRNENRRLVVSISNTEMPILKFAQQAIGAGKITNKCTYSDKHTPSYAYRLTNRQALALLDQIVDYLRSYKRLRAALALECYVAVTPRNGYYTPELRAARREFENKFLGIAVEL